jgi:hypothetical protein
LIIGRFPLSSPARDQSLSPLPKGHAKAEAAPTSTKSKNANPQKVEIAPANVKAKKHREPKVAPEKGLSQFQAAIKVLGEAGEPMGCKQIVEVMQAKGYWSSPNGKTPSQTLYAAILRDSLDLPFPRSTLFRTAHVPGRGQNDDRKADTGRQPATEPKLHGNDRCQANQRHADEEQVLAGGLPPRSLGPSRHSCANQAENLNRGHRPEDGRAV